MRTHAIADRSPDALSPNPQRRYVSPEEWVRLNPGTIGRTRLYERLLAGEIPHVRVGKKYLLPTDLLDLLLRHAA